MNTLLTREEFKKQVFGRDVYTCLCGADATEVHHIMERKLFSDGGYYLDNGISLCGTCHLLAEATYHTCNWLRECAGIKNVILPQHFDPNKKYDKWGNIIITDKIRMRGELFESNGFQKTLERNKKIAEQFEYRLFLDDERVPYDPDPNVLDAFYYYPLDTFREKPWLIIRSYKEFVDFISEYGIPDYISFDHDLGKTEHEPEKTGADCVKWLCEYCLDKKLDFPDFIVHSKNEIGELNIRSYVSTYYKIVMNEK